MVLQNFAGYLIIACNFKWSIFLQRSYLNTWYLVVNNVWKYLSKTVVDEKPTTIFKQLWELLRMITAPPSAFKTKHPILNYYHTLKFNSEQL